MEKNYLRTLCIVVVMGLFIPRILFAGSVLQITTGPGVSIWLDKDFIGKTTKEQNGLLINDLAPGEYFLKASLPGYDTAETQLAIKTIRQ